MYIIFISYIVETQIRHRVYLRGSCTLSPGCTNINEHKRLDILAILSQVISYFLSKVEPESDRTVHVFAKNKKENTQHLYVYIYNNT